MHHTVPRYVCHFCWPIAMNIAFLPEIGELIPLFIHITIICITLQRRLAWYSWTTSVPCVILHSFLYSRTRIGRLDRVATSQSCAHTEISSGSQRFDSIRSSTVRRMDRVWFKLNPVSARISTIHFTCLQEQRFFKMLTEKRFACDSTWTQQYAFRDTSSFIVAIIFHTGNRPSFQNSITKTSENILVCYSVAQLPHTTSTSAILLYPNN